MDRLESWQWLALGAALASPEWRQKLLGLHLATWPLRLRPLIQAIQKGRQEAALALKVVAGIDLKKDERAVEGLFRVLAESHRRRRQRQLALELAERDVLFSREELAAWLKKRVEDLEEKK